MLVEEVEIVFDALLVKRLNNHVTGAIGRKTGAPHGTFSEVARVSAEPALIDSSVWSTVERQPHMFELEHRVDRFARQNLRRILVDEVVTAFDGVEHMP